MIRSFPAQATSLRHIRRFVRDRAREHDLDRSAAEELTLAVSEAASNSIRHAETREVQVSSRVDGECLVIEVIDEGVFVSHVPVEELDGHSGRGILLMTAFVDNVAIREGTAASPGTTVTLIKCKAGSAPGPASVRDR